MTISRGVDGAVVVERSGTCVSIRAASVAARRGLGMMLPVEPGRAVVVVDGSAAAALDALDRRLLADLSRHLPAAVGASPGGLRLLLGGAARSGVDGSAPLAARVAEALGVEVVAPDGPLLVLRRGELFSAGPAAAWWQFAPGRSAEPVGARFPPPAWQRDLPAGLGLRSPSRHVGVTPVPCGLWVRGMGGPVAELSDRGYAVPPPPERMAVLVGRPSEAQPAVGELAEVIRALPRALRERYVLVPYGPDPAGAAPIAQRLADELGADVWATHGLPSYAEDGSLDFPAVDASGRSTWRPFVIESVYHPGGKPPTRWTWSSPPAGLPEAGAASFWLADGWLVEMVCSGLQVRPAAAGSEPFVLRRPVDPEHVDLVVTAAGGVPGAVPVPVLGAIGRLARALPRPAQDRLRMLVTDRVEETELVGLAGALGLPIRRLSRDGIRSVDSGCRSAAAADLPNPRAASGVPGDGPGPARPDVEVPPGAGHVEPRPESVGRLRASAVPAAGGVEPGPPPAVAGYAPGPDASTADRPTDLSTADGPAPAGPAAPPAADSPPAGHDQEPGPSEAPPYAVLPLHPPPAQAPPPPYQPAAAGGEPPPPPAERRPAGPPPGLPPAPAARPAPAVPAASLTAGGLASLTPDRLAGSDPWWRRASTVADRRQLRQSMGWRYDAASRFVTSLLAERPGLRAVAAGDDGLATDLAAVHTFAAADHVDRVESMRTGSPDALDRAFLTCVVSGLRWLPTLTGVVVRGGPDDPVAADAYVGGEVIEPGLLSAVADPEAEVPGATEVLIWSSTARRLDGLVDAGPPQVVFLPGTVFRVLDVDRTSSPCQVLLAEVPEVWRSRFGAERDERIRARLRAAAGSRAAARADRAGEGAAGGDTPADVEGAPAHGLAGGGLVALPGLVPAGLLRGAA